MTRHRMRLVERLIEEDSGDFIVEAPTPALAAGILLAAHDKAREQCSNVVTLPDGQRRRIEPTNVVENVTFCLLMSEEGEEIEEIEPDWESATADERQRNAQGACGPRAVQRCWGGRIESALPHLWGEVSGVIARGIPEPANV